MSSYFDLERIVDGKRHKTPFPWGELTQIWRNDTVAAILADEFPTDGFNYRERNGGYYYRRTIIPLASGKAGETTTLSTAWQEMCSELVSDEFTLAMSAFCEADLSEYKMEAVAFRGGRDTHYRPHVDSSLKQGFRLIIYFNIDWDESWGGAFRILNPVNHAEVCHSVLPVMGNASVIIRNGYDETWHEVVPLTGISVKTRNALNITWYDSSTTSTAQ
ncbi:2OG-Fe(II) oxygenase [Erwinia psidii]|uniref:2OG-Fe(II) oxygenase n=1 Tax=Erwinia psidii TaxID=69224 RepID=A0A3N6UW80_9GAMM|nr:2OG-Fe(II) oxygenase [Erwinia psidii]MCX8956883.1 2OG-Fe(II) oxygenase [Erwinia psidii]MCX8960306.1 2OG-Fe(II) oxygenase [Erwinia psidii]MCX8964514.1 2OG-Fe(II) oxygenase [Erwinia psidii]RQM40199.1 2OG-Fe(II) oxygenase [Erwinia psidii]